MVDRKRKMVMKEKCYVGNFDYDKLSSVLKQVENLIKEYGPDAEIRTRCDSYSSSDKEYMYVYKSEAETDEEMEKRIADEEKWIKIREEHDRAEFDRLQEKFGKK